MTRRATGVRGDPGRRPGAALRRAYRAALEAQVKRRPDPRDFCGQGLEGLDAYEEASDVWQTELARLEAALRTARGPSGGSGNHGYRAGSGLVVAFRAATPRNPLADPGQGGMVPRTTSPGGPMVAKDRTARMPWGGRYAEALERQAQALQWLRADPERSSDDILEAAIAEGETYYWHPDLLPVLAAGGSSLPDTARLAADMLPSPDGFCWFGTPLKVDLRTGLGLSGGIEPGDEETFRHDNWDILALLWTTIEFTDPEAAGRGPNVGIYLCVRPPDPVPEDDGPLGPWLNFCYWRFRDDLAANHAYTYDRYKDPQPGESEGLRWALNVFAAAMLFLHQGLAVPEAPAPIERHARKRVQRAGWQAEPLVRVIRLRRPRTAPHDRDEPAHVDWASRWIVRGHWRQQWFPSARENRPMWITPYVKGPEEKPLKPPRATVFAVVR